MLVVPERPRPLFAVGFDKGVLVDSSRELSDESVSPRPGADVVLELVRQMQGHSVAFTAIAPLAVRQLREASLEADEICGGFCVSEDKRARLLGEYNLWGYVGNDVKDIAAARHAGIVAVGVATGDYSTAELYAAQAHVVIPSLEAFPRVLQRFTA